MANLLIEGFGHYDTAALLQDKGRYSGTSSSTMIAGRFEGSSGYNQTSGAPYTPLPASKSVLYCGLGIYAGISISAFAGGISNWNEILNFYTFLTASPVQEMWVRGVSDGSIAVGYASATVVGQSAPNLLRFPCWHYLEVGVKLATDNTGWVEVRLDGTTVINLTNIRTAQTNAFCSALSYGVVSGVSSGVTGFCDLYVNDDQGGVNDGFMGDIRVHTLFPSAAGSTSAWTASAGDGYQCLDDNPPTEDTDYIESSTPGQRTTVAMDDLSASVVDVKVVQATIRTRRPAGSARTVAPCLHDSGGDHDGTTIYPTANYRFWRQVYDTQPDSSAWTPSAVNALEAGAVLVG